MNKTVPGAKNWPDLEMRDKQLRAKKSGLTAIDCSEEYDDATRQLTKLVRDFQKQTGGRRLVGYVGAFLYRDKHGDRRIFNTAHGKVGLDMQISMTRKLNRWIETDE
ncbi:MAG TPA: hypothetical protein VL498_06960 [Terracidiphilus sp.]|jgi:hypothetical protein|nr:hypothetical protein [Terracidiphilus sp.]